MYWNRIAYKAGLCYINKNMTNDINNNNKLKIRQWVQVGSTIVGNGYLKGFKTGDIYQGTFKKGCIPFLNCYSCPGALFSCPIGAIQNALSGAWADFDINAIPILVIGFLMLIGSLIGRAICGWACPFGFFQDLLNKIPSKKYKGFNWLKYGKIIVLLLFVIILPIVWVDEFDMGAAIDETGTMTLPTN